MVQGSWREILMVYVTVGLLRNTFHFFYKIFGKFVKILTHRNKNAHKHFFNSHQFFTQKSLSLPWATSLTTKKTTFVLFSIIKTKSSFKKPSAMPNYTRNIPKSHERKPIKTQVHFANVSFIFSAFWHKFSTRMFNEQCE